MGLADDAKSAPPSGGEAGLLDRFRNATGALHLQAEKTGIIRDLLRGKASRAGYALLLRSLIPAYRQLEAGLDRQRHAPAIEAIAIPALYRSDALRSDLDWLCGGDWALRLPLLPAAERYADRIVAVSGGEGGGLLAHAFVRYMGDLSGGQILKRLLARSLELPPDALSFYDFPALGDIEAFKADYRSGLERGAQHVGDLAPWSRRPPKRSASTSRSRSRWPSWSESRASEGEFAG